MNAQTWDDILADRSLRDLPYKIETNRYHPFIMSPASCWQSDDQLEIAALLRRLLPGGRASVECAIQSGEGVRVADTAWISKARREPHQRAVALPIAPESCLAESCVEIPPPSASIAGRSTIGRWLRK